MVRRVKREPFSIVEWRLFRDDMKEAEVQIRENAIHAGFAYGPMAQDRGMRIERDLKGYREYIGKLAFNSIADAAQYEIDWGDLDAV